MAESPKDRPRAVFRAQLDRFLALARFFYMELPGQLRLFPRGFIGMNCPFGGCFIDMAGRDVVSLQRILGGAILDDIEKRLHIVLNDFEPSTIAQTASFCLTKPFLG